MFTSDAASDDNPPLYIELPDGMLYALTVTEEMPVGPDGQTCLMHLDKRKRTAQFHESVGAARRAGMLAEAFGYDPQGVTWRLVPADAKTWRHVPMEVLSD